MPQAICQQSFARRLPEFGVELPRHFVVGDRQIQGRAQKRQPGNQGRIHFGELLFDERCLVLQRRHSIEIEESTPDAPPGEVARVRPVGLALASVTDDLALVQRLAEVSASIVEWLVDDVGADRRHLFLTPASDPLVKHRRFRRARSDQPGVRDTKVFVHR